MTVAELIEKLSQMPRDAEIRTDLEGECWFIGWAKIGGIRLEDDGDVVVEVIEN